MCRRLLDLDLPEWRLLRNWDVWHLLNENLCVIVVIICVIVLTVSYWPQFVANLLL